MCRLELHRMSAAVRRGPDAERRQLLHSLTRRVLVQSGSNLVPGNRGKQAQAIG